MEEHQQTLGSAHTRASWLEQGSFIFAISCCVIVFTYGIFVLCGKQPSKALVSQIGPSGHIMAYDTALSFCISSIGLLALIFRKNYITALAILFLIIFSVLTIVQYSFNFEWDMARKILMPIVKLKADLPGKMKPITPFCFLLASMAMLYLMPFSRSSQQKFFFAGVQAVIILCLALLFLFGYTLHADQQNFNIVILMTTNAAIGFIFLGLGLIATVIYLDKKSSLKFNHFLPVIIATFLAVISLISWGLLSSVEKFRGLINKIHWLTTLQEIVMAILIGMALYFFQRTYVFNKNFKKMYALSKATLNATHDGIVAVNAQGEMLDYNHQFSRLFHLSEEDLYEKNSQQIFSLIAENTYNSKEVNAFLRKYKEDSPGSSMCEMHLKDGRKIEFYSYPQISDTEVIGYVYSFHDISHLKLAEEKLLYQATHDILTRLPNRFLLLDHIEKAIAKADRDHTLCAILFIDLDGFKLINDSLGHLVGDKILQAVAERLTSCTRSTDTLARVGGDEFILLAVDLNKTEDAEMIAQKYNQQLSPPFNIDKHELYIRCSVGVSIYPHDSKNFKKIVENADIAMYFAKKTMQRVAFYQETMHQEVLKRLQLENELPHAISGNQLVLYYQPIIDLVNHKICDTEALVRWNHPVRGFLAPGDFIHAAEETGIISAIGSWVLKEACRQNKLWQDQGILTARISVNVSIKQLQRSDIFEEIMGILHNTGLEAKYLQLELTESRLVPDINYTASILKKFKTAGLKIAIDDFGTGYTGLGYLKYFPLDKLKIDQSLIKNFPHNLIENAIINAIINLCKEMHISACVEGVEASDQYEFLRQKQCTEAQGYYFSHPLPAEEYVKFIREFDSQKYA